MRTALASQVSLRDKLCASFCHPFVCFVHGKCANLLAFDPYVCFNVELGHWVVEKSTVCFVLVYWNVCTEYKELPQFATFVSICVCVGGPCSSILRCIHSFFKH